MSQKCTRRTRHGRPCRAWAVHGTDPPTCASHAGLTVGAGAPPGNQNRRTHGFYAAVQPPGDLDREQLLALARDETLDTEIAVARLALRRVLDLLLAAEPADLAAAGLTPYEYARLAGLAFQGARTVARLFRDKVDLASRPGAGLPAFVAQALDELAGEWDVDL